MPKGDKKMKGEDVQMVVTLKCLKIYSIFLELMSDLCVEFFFG